MKCRDLGYREYTFYSPNLLEIIDTKVLKPFTNKEKDFLQKPKLGKPRKSAITPIRTVTPDRSMTAVLSFE